MTTDNVEQEVTEDAVEDAGHDFEAEARTMGWKPQEDFKGNPDDFVDAESYVDRGRHIMPILRENNKRLQDQLLTSKKEIDTLKSSVLESQKAIKAIRVEAEKETERRVAKTKEELKSRLKEAREEGDIDEEFEIQEALEGIKEEARKSKEEPVSDVSIPEAPAVHPAFAAWQENNPWFGVDMERSNAFLKVGESLRNAGNETEGAEFFALVENTVASNNAREVSSKVESGTHSSSRSSAGPRSFSNLPKEAKEACRQFQDDLVGDDKRYKTAAEWEKAFTKTYYEENN